MKNDPIHHIFCSVDGCTHNRDKEHCALKSITVAPTSDQRTDSPHDSMCLSYESEIEADRYHSISFVLKQQEEIDFGGFSM